MGNNKMIRVEVAYAKPDQQCIVPVQVEAGSTIEMAIQQSGILEEFPEINLSKQKVGIFSKLRQLSDLANDGDRIEIYRSLILDPKEGRRVKAKKIKSYPGYDGTRK